MRSGRAWFCVAVLALLFGCDGGSGADGGGVDGGGFDGGGVDGGAVALDAQVRLDGRIEPDTGPSEGDGGSSTGSDGGSSAGSDGGSSTGSDGGSSTGSDGGSSTGSDGGSSTGSDGGSGGCPSGQMDCGSGCVDVLNDPAHCGGCSPCVGGAHATATCDEGSCGIRCDAGYGDCTAADGCETQLNTNSNCGGCGVSCTAPSGGTASCATGSCVTSCPTHHQSCGGTCYDTRSDPAHCGGCTACPSPPNATPTCSSSSCGYTCQSGYGDCTAAAGCETPLNTNSNCGGCGVSCTAPSGGTASCSTGSCVTSCGGLTECSGECVDVTSDSSHCNGCGNACTDGRSCSSSACNLLGLLERINYYRTMGTTCGSTPMAAVAALTYDATGRLDAAAQQNADWMAANEMAWYGTPLGTRLSAQGYAYTGPPAPHELFTYYPGRPTPTEVIDWLMANYADGCMILMDPDYVEWGAGATYTSDNDTTWYDMIVAVPG